MAFFKLETDSVQLLWKFYETVPFLNFRKFCNTTPKRLDDNENPFCFSKFSCFHDYAELYTLFYQLKFFRCPADR